MNEMICNCSCHNTLGGNEDCCYKCYFVTYYHTYNNIYPKSSLNNKKKTISENITTNTVENYPEELVSYSKENLRTKNEKQTSFVSKL